MFVMGERQASHGPWYNKTWYYRILHTERAHSRAGPNKMKTIKIGLDGLSALDKVAKALFIENKLTGNPNFATPQPAIGAIKAARQKLEAAIASTIDGGKASTFAKNQAEDELDEILTQEAGYVVSIAGHDEGKILSAGFEVRKQPKPIGDLPAPGNVHADLTDMPGEIKAAWDPVRGSHEFEVQRNDSDPADAAAWHVVGMTTRSRFLDFGLATGSIHWYRVRARGTAGDSPFSDPARGMAR